MTLQWYILRSQPNQEGVVWREAVARVVAFFYHQMRVQPKNPRARKIRPYFPGHLFVQLDLHQSRYSSLRYSLWSQDKPLPGCLIHSCSSLSVLSLLHLAADGLIQAIRR
jgi:hypothetical protein